MQCPLSALADAANVSAEGKLNILGEFDTLFSLGGEPIVHPSMVFVAKLKVRAGELGEHSVQLRVVDEDMHLVRIVVAGKMNFVRLAMPGVEGAFQLVIPVQLAEFPTFGSYKFQLLVDDLVVCDPEVHVRRPPPVA
jgi:hypothetical protein